MALVHDQQDSPRPAAPKVSKHDLTQATLLFLNLWGLLVGLPLMMRTATSLWDWVAACLPCALFTLGLLQETRRSRRSPSAGAQPEADAEPPRPRVTWSALCWLVGVPLSLSFCVGLNRHATLFWGLPGLLLCMLALWAYGAAALVQTVPAAPLETTRVVPLTSRTAPPGPPRWRSWWRPALFTVGGLSIGVISPYLTGQHVETTLGGEGRVWALLSAIVGGGLGATCTGVFLGSALTGAPARGGRRPAAIAPYLVISALGAITYYLITLKS